jgi:hypothetical protein
MTPEEVRAKFDDNAAAVLSRAERDRVAESVDRMEQLDDVSVLVEAAIAAAHAPASAARRREHRMTLQEHRV